MKFKLLFTVLLTFTVPFMFPFSAFAGAGAWDYKGSYWMTYQSPTIKSGGGYFQACLLSSSGSGYTFTLYEVDESGNPPETVGTAFISKGSCKTFYVNNYVDGTNDQAELVLFKGNDSYVKVSFYD
ncbi:hypothetical protein VN24_09160 [Paenibacillus beijingensis]|uniref:Secreted protein n=1 Tax=Paenibacillus beijingensis TaxID=1126833 RepID=A0A0D5NQW4_9BACL|nr:hypothetical protein VN24_09160 [Paenibacillus beijingensis]